MDPITAAKAAKIGKDYVEAGIDQMNNCPYCHRPPNIGRGRDAGWSCRLCGAQFDERQRRRLGGR